MSRNPGAMRGTNGSGGYSNGYGRDGGYGGFGYAEDESPRRPSGDRPSGERRRRPGGYGGLEYGEDAPAVQAPSTSDRMRGRQGSGDRRYDGPGRASFGAGSQRMEEVLKYIRQNWDFMTNEKCVPVEVALKLMDQSSLGLASQYGRFKATHQELQLALKTIVNEHHQGFNSSIGTFHKIQSSLQQSQQRVRTLKDSLGQAKSQLSTTKPELKDFATASQKYDEMIQMLQTIEQLQLVPDKLEARISEKRFLSAVDVLQEALTMIKKSEMENIGALGDLRIYLSNQKTSLTDILVEELHNHLYLKSPYCEDRWRVYAQNQTKGDLSERVQSDVRGRLLYQFLDGVDLTEPMTDDSTGNPEADTFQYIQLIIESLYKMGGLEYGVNVIEQRLPVELFKIVDKTNNEVAQRHPSLLRAYTTKTGGKLSAGADSDDLRAGLLTDLLWTLYARFEAIAEGHRVIHDVITGMLRREGLRDTAGSALTRGFKELWKLYQSEIRSLLHDYLATDSDLGYRGGQGQNLGTSSFSRAPRDKNKRMFKLTDIDTKSTELAQERERLELILRSSVPGLVSDSKRPEDLAMNASSNLDGSATGHKLLVEPSVFNMGILLTPSLDFLTRLKEVVPSSSDIIMSTLTSFLDDFLVNVFLPQLDETLVELCTQTFIDIDAFQQDADWQRHSKKPIFKGTVKFFSLITAFCKMLDSLPHDQAFSQLIITQMDTYVAKCQGWYKALVNRASPKEPTGRYLKFPAAYAAAENPIGEVVAELFLAEPEQAAALVDREISLLLAKIEEDPVDQQDMIQDKKGLQSLCLLYTSMKWLATKVAQLRYISDRTTDSSKAAPGHPRLTRRWTHLSSPDPRADGTAVYLPLNKDTAAAFDTVLAAYTSLSSRVLRTLHLSLRLTVLSSLHTTLHPSYTLETPLSDPEPSIQALSQTLTSYDSTISTYLPPPQHTLATAGLAKLADTYLLQKCSAVIRDMNAHGCALMQLNILVLQQNLLHVEPSARLANAALFFDLFDGGADAIVARAKRYGKGFGVGEGAEGGQDGQGQGLWSQDVVKGLLELWYGERLKDERREVGLQARRQLDGQVLEISEFMY